MSFSRLTLNMFIRDHLNKSRKKKKILKNFQIKSFNTLHHKSKIYLNIDLFYFTFCLLYWNCASWKNQVERIIIIFYYQQTEEKKEEKIMKHYLQYILIVILNISIRNFSFSSKSVFNNSILLTIRESRKNIYTVINLSFYYSSLFFITI